MHLERITVEQDEVGNAVQAISVFFRVAQAPEVLFHERTLT